MIRAILRRLSALMPQAERHDPDRELADALNECAGWRARAESNAREMAQAIREIDAWKARWHSATCETERAQRAETLADEEADRLREEIGPLRALHRAILVYIAIPSANRNAEDLWRVQCALDTCRPEGDAAPVEVMCRCGRTPMTPHRLGAPWCEKEAP